MSYIVDIYQAAVKYANNKTYEKFLIHGPYTPGSKEHDFWLKALDEYTMKKFLPK